MQSLRSVVSVGVTLSAFAGATMLASCEPPEVCGPCGSLATGQLSISGNTQLDGFFTAVADLQGASAQVRGQFEADVRALGEVYGLAEGTIDAAFVGELIGEIQDDIRGHVDGDFTLKLTPARCSADVSVAVEAQAQCEANADCEVQADPGMASVMCEGKCEGSCEGGCSGEVSCTPPGGSVNCELGCEGTCEIDGAMVCEGTCRGGCSGACSLTNAENECEGHCDGECTGTCELSARAECDGTCHGTCHAEATPPECENVSVQCSAQCMGSCEGGCAGAFEPPSASADCDASAECNAQASAQAEANVTCTPPSIEFAFELDAGLTADAQAAFLARLDLLRVRLAGILQGAARAEALWSGKVDGEVVFDPSPFARVKGEVQHIANAGLSGDLDIATGRIVCVIPAFEEASDAFVDVGADLQFTAEASAMFVAFVGNPQG